jgi:hypothetical protein
MKSPLPLILSACAFICNSLHAQEYSIIAQPVVCASSSAGGNSVVSTLPAVVTETGGNLYQAGFFLFAPEQIATSVLPLPEEDTRYPTYDGNALIVPVSPGRNRLVIYSVTGQVLKQIIVQTGEQCVRVEINDLPFVAILRVEHADKARTFKLFVPSTSRSAK